VNIVKYKNGQIHYLDNGNLVRVEYINGNYVYKHSDNKWYRQDGSRLIMSPYDIYYWNSNDILYRVERADGYIEELV
jgi:hypothetical protein